MYSVHPSLPELLALCGVAALVLERVLTVLCGALPGAASNWLGHEPKFPLRDSVTLAAAVAIAHALPLHLIEAFKAGAVPSAIDTAVAALFITGLAQLMHRVLSSAAVGAAGSSAAAPRAFEPPAATAIPAAMAPRLFKLGSLKTTPLAAAAIGQPG
jgi:hypothetical protein